jgi:hypothetical protein
MSHVFRISGLKFCVLVSLLIYLLIPSNMIYFSNKTLQIVIIVNLLITKFSSFPPFTSSIISQSVFLKFLSRATLTLSDPTSDLVRHYDFPVPI